MQTARRAFLLGLAALVLVGCGHARRGAEGVATEEPTMLRVENQAFLDMNIYLIVGAQRIRLGTATGNGVTKLRIPSRYVFGPTPLRFLADPIGGSRTPISDTITVLPGDEVTLLIPPGV